MDSKYCWISKGAKIFKNSDIPQEFGYYGWGDLSLQLIGYIEGYKNAADNLVDTALESENIKTLDTFIFPICFSYRHCLELSMKRILLRYSEKSEQEVIEIVKKVSHNLLKIWEVIEPIIEKHCSDSEKEDLVIAKDYILQVHFFDQDSFSFRYPITKNLELIHKEWEYLDLRNLKEKMNEIYTFFDCVNLALDERIKANNEMLKYLGSYE